MSEDTHKYDPHEHEPMPEGEEEAPPLIHTMAVVRWVILGAMSLFALVMILNYFDLTPWSGAAADSIQYHCPMHPTYISNQPGDCPICGMSLVPIDASGKEMKSTANTGSSETRSEGMAQSKAQPGQYTCPMHPEIVSDKPGKCPKCGMFLEQVPVSDGAVHGNHDMSSKDRTKSKSDHADMGLGTAPVPGLVPVTIEPQRLQLIGVRSGRVEKRALDGSLRLVGFVTPDETKLANIHVRFSGWVKELAVDETGQFVEANQRLLSIYSQDLFQAEQEYIVAKQATRRAADNVLNETRFQLLEAARRRLELLGAPPEIITRLDTAKVPSSEVWIRSNFSGYVLEKNVVNGQFIDPGQDLFTIADLRTVWVLADVYEQDLAGLKVGQKVKMTTLAHAGETFDGAIGFIYPSVAEETRTLKVRIVFSNPSLKLRPGMYSEIDLAGHGQKVLTIPADAVMDGGERQYAFVVHEGNHFEPRLLKIGKRSDDFMEVLSGLSEGEEVVTGANFLIDSESRLKAAIAGMGSTQPDVHAGHGK